MNKTAIGWCDYTWNPIVGCSRASIGCRLCYAGSISKRFGYPWGEAVFKPERLSQPTRIKKGRFVFVCSMSDYFHPTVQSEWRDAVEQAMAAAPQHTYIILTKRPELAANWKCPTGVWFGTTTENQEMFDSRVPHLLLHTEAAKLVISAEPLLGPIELGNTANAVDWIIAGPERGPGATPCDPTWLTMLANQSNCFFDMRKVVTYRHETPSVTEL